MDSSVVDYVNLVNITNIPTNHLLHLIIDSPGPAEACNEEPRTHCRAHRGRIGGGKGAERHLTASR